MVILEVNGIVGYGKMSLFKLHDFFLARPCGMWDPQSGIEPSPPAVETQSLNHWTPRKSLHYMILNKIIISKKYLYRMSTKKRAFSNLDNLNLYLKRGYWASLVAQWLRIRLPMQGTRVRALAWEDPTCRGATRPVSHNY